MSIRDQDEELMKDRKKLLFTLENYGQRFTLMNKHQEENATLYQEVSLYLIALRKCWNISMISASHSRSNITTQDLTLATVSRIEVLLMNERLDLSDKFSNDDTIN